MGEALKSQAERLYGAVAELVRAYQFRDREGICCHGLSVSQCYSLEAIEMHGPVTMGDLADRLYLEVSSMTRIVDHLVRTGLARRVEDAKDRRICRVEATAKGRSLMAKIRDELVEGHRQILSEVPADSREVVIGAVSNLLSAFKQRRSCCSEERTVTKKQSKRRAS